MFCVQLFLESDQVAPWQVAVPKRCHVANPSELGLVPVTRQPLRRRRPSQLLVAFTVIGSLACTQDFANALCLNVRVMDPVYLADLMQVQNVFDKEALGSWLQFRPQFIKLRLS